MDQVSVPFRSKAGTAAAMWWSRGKHSKIRITGFGKEVILTRAGEDLHDLRSRGFRVVV